jgi:3-methyladenine DNA glycosylase Tag
MGVAVDANQTLYTSDITTTICYAHLQAAGFVNVHVEGCPFKYLDDKKKRP